MHTYPALDSPIIIIGNGGSGSSLLNHMLNAHPEIIMKGEMRFLVPHAWAAFWKADANSYQGSLKVVFDGDPTLEIRMMESRQEYDALLQKLTDIEEQRTGSILRDTIGKWFRVSDATAKAWGFKEIWNGGGQSYDWHCYDRIFPRAIWVHIVRHPLTQVRAAARLSGQKLTAETIGPLLSSWLATVEMSKRREVTGRFFELKFEDLAATPRQTLCPLFEGVGVSWDDEVLLPLGRQWGSRSAHDTLPAGFQQSTEAVSGLTKAMKEYGYSLEEPPLATARADILTGAIEPLNDNHWKIVGPILREQGLCWDLDLSRTTIADRLSNVADDVDQWHRSPLRLFEDHKPLGPAHAVHARIRDTGGGTYSHWRTRLMFSTSDNTNPNNNGRVYTFKLAGDY